MTSKLPLQRFKQFIEFLVFLLYSRSGHITFSVILRCIIVFVVFRYILGANLQTASEEKQEDK